MKHRTLMAGSSVWLAISSLAQSAELPKIPDNSGGVVVYVGAPDKEALGELGDLAKKPQFVAQILTQNPNELTKLRASAADLDAAGCLSVQTYNKDTLPLITNMVNHIICADGSSLSRKEVMRALAPRGVAYFPKGSSWEKVVKPVPSDVDDWTHALYNTANTVVSKDQQVGPPRRLQWINGPGWSRSHEQMVSFTAMVSEGGIYYYIIDLGARSAVALPARWTLIARDAYNGKELWHKDLPSWMNHMWPIKSGPTQIQRRLVAVNGKVYLPLGALAPISELDGRTGKVLKTYEGTSNVDEILIDGDQMIVQMGEQVVRRENYKHKDSHVWAAAGSARKHGAWQDTPATIASINIKTGKTDWSQESPCVAMTLHLDKDSAYFFNGTGTCALSRKTGEVLWTSEKIVPGDVMRNGEMASGYAPTMFSYGGAVVIQLRESRGDGEIFGFDPKTGKTLWHQKALKSGHHSPEDLLPMQGLLWTGATATMGKGGGNYQGINPLTGEIEKEFMKDVNPNYWFHQRCYRAKGTEKYLMPSATGIEYVDPETGKWEINHWLRGGCLLGVMPANGITYVPPNPCACFSESQLRGIGAFASAEEGKDLKAIDSKGRFVKGPAFDAVKNQATGTGDWPMYRSDVTRSGATKSQLAPVVKEKWRVAFNGKISAPVVANGLALVSLIDDHQIAAVDETNGKVKWRYHTGARVDSAPTTYQGRVLFGCADGWITCLRMTDGEVVWRYRAAPQDKQLCVDEQIESVWPLIGSVLVHNEQLYAVAGRSMFIDGGLLMTVLNPLTGELINEVRFDDVDPITGEHMQMRTQGSIMPSSRPDVLSVKGDFIFMGSQKIAKDGSRVWPATKGSKPGEKSLTLNKSSQGGDDVHLMSLSGFLDDSWFHRTYWLYGVATGGGWGGWIVPMKLVPAGRILSVGDDTVYGYGRKPTFIRQSTVTEYQIFATKKGQFSKEKARAMTGPKPELVMGPEQAQRYNKLKKDAAEAKKKHGNKHPEALKAARLYSDFRSQMKQLPINKKNDNDYRDSNPNIADWKASAGFDDSKTVLLEYDWRELDPKVMVRAMALAGETLVVAGPADILDETSLYGQFTAPENQDKLSEQEAAFNGERGGHLWLLDTKDGKHLTEIKLNSVPVFDGMAVANGRVLLSQVNGELVSFGK